MPGITMPPDASISVVPFGTSSDGPTAEIRSPSMRTSASRSTDRDGAMVSTVPFRKTTGAPGLMCTLASAATLPPAISPRGHSFVPRTPGTMRPPLDGAARGVKGRGGGMRRASAYGGSGPAGGTDAVGRPHVTDRTHDAVVVETPGEPPAVRRREPPSPRSGEVTIRVSAAPIAPLDLLCATGRSYFGVPATPYVPGVQGVGTVEQGTAAVPAGHHGVVCDLGRDGSGRREHARRRDCTRA